MANATLTAADPPLTYSLQPTALLIAAAGPGAAEMAEALRLGGMRVLAETGLAGAAHALAERIPDLIAIDAGDGADPLLDPALAAIETAMRTQDVAVIAAMPAVAIDAVSARLLGGGASQLLCEPAMAERVAAVVALRDRASLRLNDASRDGELAPLQRLNEEVARIADLMARLTRGEEVTRQSVRDPTPGYRGPELVNGAGAPDVGPAEIRAAIRARRLRAQYFAEELFADPAWDMLLDLYVALLEGRRVSVSSLCIAAAVPPTTALRWIGTMHDAGLFERHADPMDRRRAYIALSDKAVGAMRGYLAAMRRAGLPIS